jgi:uncharacterized membrane protein
MFLAPIAEFGGILLDVHGVSSTEEAVDISTMLPFPMSAIVIGLMLLTLFVLFSYKNRKRQLLLGRLNYFLILALVVVVFLTISDIQEQLNDGNSNPYGIAAYLPIISLGFHLLANRAIKRDEELVKSLDRLR